MSLFSKDEPTSYEVNGRKLICHNCQNDQFNSREAQLNTAVASFFNFDWANRSATCFVCAEYSYILWFLV